MLLNLFPDSRGMCTASTQETEQLKGNGDRFMYFQYHTNFLMDYSCDMNNFPFEVSLQKKVELTMQNQEVIYNKSTVNGTDRLISKCYNFGIYLLNKKVTGKTMHCTGTCTCHAHL